MNPHVPMLVHSPSIVPILRTHGVTWERALTRFIKIATKGHHFDIEHAQRVASIFCQGGSATEALRWNRLLRSESIPFCTTQLASLAHHSLWDEIRSTMHRTAFPWQPLVAEAAMAIAAKNNQWVASLEILNTFPALGAPRPRLAIGQLDTPNRAIAGAFAFGLRSSTWEESVSLCLRASSVCSIATAHPLTELALLKMMHSGEISVIDDALASLEFNKAQWTARVTRIALRVSLAKRDIKRCVDLVKYGHKQHGDCFSRHLLLKVIDMAVRTPDQTMELIVLRQSLAMVKRDNDSLLQVVFSALADRERLTSPARHEMRRSQCHIHETIQRLVKSGQWRNALAIAKAFNSPALELQAESQARLQ